MEVDGEVGRWGGGGWVEAGAGFPTPSAKEGAGLLCRLFLRKLGKPPGPRGSRAPLLCL